LPLKVVLAVSDVVAGLWAEVRLPHVLLHTKLILSAFTVRGGGSTATCAVEPLKDEPDSMGRTDQRFDEEAAPMYGGVVTCAWGLLQRAGFDWGHLVGIGLGASVQRRLPLRGGSE
jgi:hypothetical protein